MDDLLRRAEEMQRDLPKVMTPAEFHAEALFEALETELRAQESTLRAGEELRAYFWNGYMRLRVLAIELRGRSVAVLYCRDDSDYNLTVLASVEGITLTCQKVKLQPEEKRHTIGFSMTANDTKQKASPAV